MEYFLPEENYIDKDRYYVGNDIVPDIGLKYDPTCDEYSVQLWCLKMLKARGWKHPIHTEFLTNPNLAKQWAMADDNNLLTESNILLAEKSLSRWGINFDDRFTPRDIHEFKVPNIENNESKIDYIARVSREIYKYFGIVITEEEITGWEENVLSPVLEQKPLIESEESKKHRDIISEEYHRHGIPTINETGLKGYQSARSDAHELEHWRLKPSWYVKLTINVMDIKINSDGSYDGATGVIPDLPLTFDPTFGEVMVQKTSIDLMKKHDIPVVTEDGTVRKYRTARLQSYPTRGSHGNDFCNHYYAQFSPNSEGLISDNTEIEVRYMDPENPDQMMEVIEQIWQAYKFYPTDNQRKYTEFYVKTFFNQKMVKKELAQV